MSFRSTGTFMECVCDTCQDSLFDMLGLGVETEEAGRVIAYALDWHLGDQVSCNLCRMFALTELTG